MAFTVKFKFLSATKNKFRFIEVNDKGVEVGKEAIIGALYVDKSEFPKGAPAKIVIDITAFGKAKIEVEETAPTKPAAKPASTKKAPVKSAPAKQEALSKTTAKTKAVAKTVPAKVAPTAKVSAKPAKTTTKPVVKKLPKK